MESGPFASGPNTSIPTIPSLPEMSKVYWPGLKPGEDVSRTYQMLGVAGASQQFGTSQSASSDVALDISSWSLYTRNDVAPSGTSASVIGLAFANASFA